MQANSHGKSLAEVAASAQVDAQLSVHPGKVCLKTNTHTHSINVFSVSVLQYLYPHYENSLGFLQFSEKMDLKMKTILKSR